MVGDWYMAFYGGQADMATVTAEQLAAYERKGAERNRVWSRV